MGHAANVLLDMNLAMLICNVMSVQEIRGAMEQDAMKDQIIALNATIQVDIVFSV